ncbi:MAG: hypothetical protein ABW252_24640 [Polyangiales bacterium]
MKFRSLLSAGAFAMLMGVVGCADHDVAESVDVAEQSQKQAAKLNLSHIACTDDGKVEVHFVLLFAGTGKPGQLTGTYNGGTFTIDPGANTGNVWHYTTFLNPGYIDIISAKTTTSGGTVVVLKNPSEYAGEYVCGEPVPECPTPVAPKDVYCVADKKGGNSPDTECGWFDLAWTAGKDGSMPDNTYSWPALETAYVALVKSGTHGCDNGDKAYRVYVGVKKGDVLQTPVDQGISHITYCNCPPQ